MDRPRRLGLAPVLLLAVAASLMMPAARVAATAAFRWKPVPGPSVAGTTDDTLAGIACPARGDCWAVGQAGQSGGRSAPLVEHYDGRSWSADVAPAPAGSYDAMLYSVACPSPAACWAVGVYSDQNVTTSPTSAMVERYAAGRWSLAATISRLPMDAGLQAVACPDATDCWAVGYLDAPGSGDTALIVHHGGSGWKQATALSGAVLRGVSCASSADCLAVGSVIDHFDGTAWRLVPSPSPKNGQPTLDAVSCAATHACAIVGYAPDGRGGAFEELVMQTAVSGAAVPSTAALSQLTAVTCLKPRTCVAVGSQNSVTGFPRMTLTLAEAQAGGRWSVTPTPPQTASSMAGVACDAPGSCWAVGSRWTNAPKYTMCVIGQPCAQQHPPAIYRPLIEHGVAGTTAGSAGRGASGGSSASHQASGGTGRAHTPPAGGSASGRVWPYLAVVGFLLLLLLLLVLARRRRTRQGEGGKRSA